MQLKGPRLYTTLSGNLRVSLEESIPLSNQIYIKDSFGNWQPVSESNPVPITPLLTLGGTIVQNALEISTYNLSGNVLSASTNIIKDYVLDSIELKFSTTEQKTITIFTDSGVILWGGTLDTSPNNLGYKTKNQHFNLQFDQAFNANDNININVTSTTNTCILDGIVRIRTGVDSLMGNPSAAVYLIDPSGNPYGVNHVSNNPRVVLTDGTTNVGVDSYSDSLNQIDVDHSKHHEGKAFSFSETYIIESGENLDFLLHDLSGATHLRTFAFTPTTAPGEIYLFENTITSNDGTIQTTLNKNRNSSTISNMLLYKSPMILSGGTLLEKDVIVGEHTSGGVQSRMILEWILRPNTKYLLRYSNKSSMSSDVNIFIYWLQG